MKKLIEKINEMEKGTEFWVNTFALSFKEIDKVKEYVNRGIIIPDAEEIKSQFKKYPEQIESLMNGSAIAVLMRYYKA